MSEDQLKQCWSIYTDCWKLIKAHPSKLTDQEAKEVTAQADKLIKDYGIEFQPIVLDTLELLERMNK